jgi:hypothetical protein
MKIDEKEEGAKKGVKSIAKKEKDGEEKWSGTTTVSASLLNSTTQK